MSRIVREDLRLVGSLRDTAKQYFDLKGDRAETAVKLYQMFLKDYILRSSMTKKVPLKNLRSFLIRVR